MSVAHTETRSERAHSRVALISLTLAVAGVGLAIG